MFNFHPSPIYPCHHSSLHCRSHSFASLSLTLTWCPHIAFFNWPIGTPPTSNPYTSFFL
eukprot:c17379_g1_i1 orf=1-174(-)